MESKPKQSGLTTRKVVKDMKLILKDFEPMVKDPKNLWNGRDISNFFLRPREAWANWLLCAVLQKLFGGHVTFADDEEGDGLMVDRGTGEYFHTEHVCALEIPNAPALPSGEQRVIDAIEHKIRKGEEYARGKWLVVFFDGAGEYFRNKIREAIKGRHNFVAVYCIGLLTSGPDGYSYAVTEFRDSLGDRSITYRVDINSNFDGWRITLL